MIIDLQVRAELLARIIRNRFVSESICVDLPDQPGADQVVVDHLEFGEVVMSREMADITVRQTDGSDSTVPGHRVRFTQPITAYIATHAQIVAGGAKGPQEFLRRVSIDLFFDLTGQLEVDDNNVVTGAAITLSYAGNNFPDDVLPPEFQATVDEVLQDVAQSTPLDLGPLAQVLKADTIQVGNVGVAIDPSLSRVAIRVELAPVAANASTAWASFYNNIPDNLFGRDWSVLVDNAILTQSVRAEFVSQLQESNNPTEEAAFELIGTPAVMWQPTVPGILLYFEGNITNVCAFISIEVEVTVQIRLSIEPGTPPRLKVASHLTWNAVDSDVLLCSLGFATFLGTWGAIVGSAASPIGAAIGAVAGIVVGIVAPAIFAGSVDASALPAGNIPDGCEQTSPDDADYIDTVCYRTLRPLDVAFMGSLAPDELRGTAAGLLLLGSVEMPQMEDQFFAGMVPLEWDMSLNCANRGVDIELRGGVDSGNAAGIEWEICDIHVENDRLVTINEDTGEPVPNSGFFIPAFTSANRITINLNYPFWDEYFVNPYPCQLYVRYSRGARWFDFGILPKQPKPPSKDKVLVAWGKWCAKHYDDYWNGGWNPFWLIDPDPPWERMLHRWDIVVTGLRESDESVVAGARSQVVATAMSNAHGRAVHSTVLTPALSAGGLKLSRRSRHARTTILRGSMREEPPADGQILVTQTLLVQQGAVALSGRLRSCTLSARDGSSGFFAAITTTGLHVYALPAPNFRSVRLTFQILDPGLRGVAALSGGLLIAGDDGVSYRTFLADGRLAGSVRVLATPASAVTVVRGLGCVAVQNGVQILNGARRPWRLMALDDVVMIGTLRGRLAVLKENGSQIALYEPDPNSDDAPTALGVMSVPSVVKFRGDSFIGPVDAPDTVTVPGAGIMPVQRDGWLAGSWRLPRQYVHIDAPQGVLEVFMASRRRQLWKSQRIVDVLDK